MPRTRSARCMRKAGAARQGRRRPSGRRSHPIPSSRRRSSGSDVPWSRRATRRRAAASAKAISLNPRDEVAFYQLAQAHRALGQEAEQQKALAEFERLRSAKATSGGGRSGGAVDRHQAGRSIRHAAVNNTCG